MAVLIPAIDLISLDLSTFAKALVDKDNTLDVCLNTAGGPVYVAAGGNSQVISSQPISQDLQSFIFGSLSRLDSLIGLNFRFINNPLNADINFYVDSSIDLGIGGTTYGITFNNNVAGRRWSEILINGNALSSQANEFKYYTVLHEFGHAFGLEHPFDNSDGDYYGSTNPLASAFANDTLMAYRPPQSGTWPTWYTGNDTQALLQVWGSPLVFRLYSGSTGEHLFTSSQQEIDLLTGGSTSKFINEGVAYATPSNGTQALYRFLQLSSGLHFYTANNAERDSLIANSGQSYQFEGQAYTVYAASSAPTGATPVYRFYDPARAQHFYTANSNEVASVRATSPSWVFEGPAWYV
jgi:hypothetical protein